MSTERVSQGLRSTQDVMLFDDEGPIAYGCFAPTPPKVCACGARGEWPGRACPSCAVVPVVTAPRLMVVLADAQEAAGAVEKATTGPKRKRRRVAPRKDRKPGPPHVDGGITVMEFARQMDCSRTKSYRLLRSLEVAGHARVLGVRRGGGQRRPPIVWHVEPVEEVVQ